MKLEINNLNSTDAKEAIADTRAQLDTRDRKLAAEMMTALKTIPSANPVTAEQEKNSDEPATNIAKQPPTPSANPQQTRNNDVNGEPPMHVVPSHLCADGSASASPSLRDQYAPAFGPLGYLNTLPPEKQEYVRQLIAEYPFRKAAEILSGPAPDGFGLPITSDSLFRFNRRHKQSVERRQLSQVAAQTRECLDDPQSTDQQFTTAAVRYLRADLLDTITELNSLEMIATVHKMLNQLRRTDLAERRQTYLERAKA